MASCGGGGAGQLRLLSEEVGKIDASPRRGSNAAEEEGSKEGEQSRELLARGISGDASSSFLGSRAKGSGKGGDKQGELAGRGAEVGECVVCREYIEEVFVKLPRRQLFPDGGSII